MKKELVLAILLASLASAATAAGPDPREKNFTFFVDGVQIDGRTAYLVGGLVLGIANTIIKPILAILTLPLIVFTLGLFYLLINIAMVALAEWIAPNFSVNGFWSYVGVVVVVWLVNWAVNAFLERTVGRERI